MDGSAVLTARLATQRLTGAPAETPTQVVRELVCVQSQDALLAQAMIAQRCAGATDATVRAALAAGDIVRTHILRPTWHYVSATDLRWLLALTSPKVESGMAARHRQLELDDALVAASMVVLSERLKGRAFTNRTGLGEALADAGLLSREHPLFGQQLAHVVLLAELRALVCSAPVAAADHHYALLEEVVPATPERTREEALSELVARFVAGHGPVALSDLTRWARVTLGEARTALAALGDQVQRVVVDSDELWRSPEAALPTTRPQEAWLLSTFDEAFLSYRKVPWPRSANHPSADPYRFAESGGGVVLLGLEDVGAWKRTRTRDGARIGLAIDDTLSERERLAVDEAVDRLLAVIE